MSDVSPVRATLTTPAAPGAIALISLHGDPASLRDVLEQLTGRAHWPASKLRLVALDQIDEGLVGLVRDDLAWLMPHGSPHGNARILQALQQRGVEITSHISATLAYPEARDDVEAAMLAALPHCVSPVAVDRLLEQPDLWRRWRDALHHDQDRMSGPTQAEQIVERADRWHLLLQPATVCVVGPANVGKSTLTNTLAGHGAAVVADRPGTTRDWVGASVLLEGVAVHWLDTPGLRRHSDEIETRAQALTRPLIQDADCVIAMRDTQSDWPEPDALPRQPDLWVVSKADLIDEAARAPDAARAGCDPANPLWVSAHAGQGLSTLARRVIHVLGLADALAPDALPWAFDRALLEQARGIMGT